MDDTPEALLRLVTGDHDPRSQAVYSQAIDRQLLSGPPLTRQAQREQIEAWDRFCSEFNKEAVQAAAQKLIAMGCADLVLKALSGKLSACLLNLSSSKRPMSTQARMIRTRFFDVATWLLALEFENLERAGVDRIALLRSVAELDLEQNSKRAREEIEKAVRLISAIPREYKKASTIATNASKKTKQRKPPPGCTYIQMDESPMKYTGIIQIDGILIKRRDSPSAKPSKAALPPRLIKILCAAYAISYQKALASNLDKEMECDEPLLLEFKAQDLTDLLGNEPNRTDLQTLRECVNFKNGEILFTAGRYRKSSIPFSIDLPENKNGRELLYEMLSDGALRTLGLIDRGKA